MKHVGLIAAGVSILVAVTAPSAHASVVVLSSKLFDGSGHYIVTLIPPPTTVDSAPTTYVETPFPTDTRNGIGSDGTHLKVKVGQTAGNSVFRGNVFRPSETWTVKRAEIQFQLDEPGTYSIAWSAATGTGPFPSSIKLIASDNSVVKSVNSFFPSPVSDTLPAGIYTLVTSTGLGSSADSSLPSGLGSFGYGYVLDLTLDVTSVPEPSALGFVAAGGVILARRRSR